MNRLLPLCFGLLLFVAACGAEEEGTQPDPVRSHLAGRITLSPEVDSTDSFAGFEVLVALTGEDIDTLGFAVTDSSGAFAMDVEAPERGLYPIFISRGEGLLRQGELVVAEGDTARLTATFPMGNRLLRIISPENAAWLAFRNTRAQHTNQLVQIVQTEGYNEEAIRNSVLQAARILWSMRETYPNTVGSERASAEAVAMVGGWSDSLAVAWARQVQPSEAGYTSVVQVAREAQTRLAGPAAARDLVRSFLARAETDDTRARLQQELVLAFINMNEPDSALAVARSLQTTYPDTPWASWADRAVYELEHLLPGMEAPAFTAQTYGGGRIRLDSLRGQYVVLEYYAPQDQTYQRELDIRSALYQAVSADSLEIVSISVEPDTVLNEAFLDGRDLPGLHVIAPNGLESDLANLYNVNVLPTRYLIGPDGRFIGKYIGETMTALYQDVLSLLAEDELVIGN